MRYNRTIALLIAGGTLAGLTACGNDDSPEKISKDVQEQGQKLREQAADAQRKATEIADKVKSGELSGEDARKQLQEQTQSVQDDARKLAEDAVERLRKSGDLPDEAKQQIEEAKKQLEQMGN